MAFFFSRFIFGLFYLIAVHVVDSIRPPMVECNRLADVDGFLIDLDGTMYGNDGLIPGALQFFEWLLSTNKSYVFVSNSASKGPLGVQSKFETPPWKLPVVVATDHVWTASQGLAFYLKNHVPKTANVNMYIIGSISKYGNISDSCISVLQEFLPAEMSLWNWRTDLTEDEIKQWAATSHSNPGNTFVINCIDVQVGDFGDPVTHKPGYSDWNYSLFSKAQWLFMNGATLISSAPDVWSPPEVVGDLIFPIPVGGAFEKLLQYVTFPRTINKSFNVGKGGNKGTDCMMRTGITLLKKQGASGELGRTAMVGDTLYTDVEAGASSGMQAVFVLSGVSRLSDMSFFPTAIPTCILNNVGEIPHYASSSHTITKELSPPSQTESLI